MPDPIRIVNLTPHTVTIVGQDGQVVLSPDGPPARCAEVVHEMGNWPTSAGRVPFVEVSYGPVTDLPKPSPGIMYLVSQVVVAALPERTDLAFPSDLIRDGEGRVIGCRALARPKGDDRVTSETESLTSGSRNPRDKIGQWWETLKTNRLAILLFLIMGLALSLAVASASKDGIDTWYGHLFDPVVGLGTFVVAVAVWLRTAKSKWEDALPKTLIVRFTVGSATFLEVTSLPLVGPADIRNFSQQAIRKWNKGDVKLGLNFTIRPGVPVRRKDGRWVQQWVCEYPLDEKPGESCTDPHHAGAKHVWRIDPLSSERSDLCEKATDQ